MAGSSNCKYEYAHYRNEAIPSDAEWIRILHNRAKYLTHIIEFAEKKRRDTPNHPHQKDADAMAEDSIKKIVEITQEIRRIAKIS